MIKAILFDFDGVLTIEKTGSVSITNYLAAQTGIAADVIRQCYYPHNNDLLYGRITHKEMWKDFCKEVGYAIEYQLLIDSFVHTALDERMIKLVKQLKEEYLIGMITDNKSDRIETVLEKNHLESCFDVVAVSANIRSGKEQSAIFEYTLRTLGVRAEECIFIDNTSKNLRIPSAMGMQTILFNDEERDIDAFFQSLNKLL